MPASPAQIKANRANAQLSTGPRTGEGKLASSSNSTTSGLTSSKIFVRPDQQAEFDEFESALALELKPRGLSQSNLYAQILHAAWNIRRCYALESHIQNEANARGFEDALYDDELSRNLDRVYRYKRMHESTHRRATADLRQLQTEQIWRRESSEGLEQESILADTAKVILKLNQSSTLQQRANLDVLRQQIEGFIAPPRPARDQRQ
jgi:hypothetical protein